MARRYLGWINVSSPGRYFAASNVRGKDRRFSAQNLVDNQKETYWAKVRLIIHQAKAAPTITKFGLFKTPAIN